MASPIAIADAAPETFERVGAPDSPGVGNIRIGPRNTVAGLGNQSNDDRNLVVWNRARHHGCFNSFDEYLNPLSGNRNSGTWCSHRLLDRSNGLIDHSN